MVRSSIVGYKGYVKGTKTTVITLNEIQTKRDVFHSDPQKIINPINSSPINRDMSLILVLDSLKSQYKSSTLCIAELKPMVRIEKLMTYQSLC